VEFFCISHPWAPPSAIRGGFLQAAQTSIRGGYPHQFARSFVRSGASCKRAASFLARSGRPKVRGNKTHTGGLRKGSAGYNFFKYRLASQLKKFAYVACEAHGVLECWTVSALSASTSHDTEPTTLYAARAA
jgi:hypothetical protein